jgi:hypothetical protein
MTELATTAAVLGAAVGLVLVLRANAPSLLLHDLERLFRFSDTIRRPWGICYT